MGACTRSSLVVKLPAICILGEAGEELSGMRASLERTGGFAGVRLASTADTEELSPEDAQRLKQLVDSANFFQLPEADATSKSLPDRFQYTLTVEDGNRKRTITIPES